MGETEKLEQVLMIDLLRFNRIAQKLGRRSVKEK